MYDEGLVIKFGGTSLGSVERIQKAAKCVEFFYKNYTKKIVVVASAMGQSTDELIALAHSVSDRPDLREMDMLLTSGERISVSLLTMALKDLKIPSTSWTGSQSGILTTCTHGNAKIISISGERIKESLQKNQISIVAGFQGVSSEREITTLGRGGSDTTAVALAYAMGFTNCWIFTDVPGIMSGNPKIVDHSILFPEISLDQLMEACSAGAQVMEPRSLFLAKKFGIKLKIGSFLEHHDWSQEPRGTEVMLNHRYFQPMVSVAENAKVFKVNYDKFYLLNHEDFKIWFGDHEGLFVSIVKNDFAEIINESWKFFKDTGIVTVWHQNGQKLQVLSDLRTIRKKAKDFHSEIVSGSTD